MLTRGGLAAVSLFRVRLRALGGVVAALALLFVVALAEAAQAAKRPIVYVVVIDGLDGDSFEQGLTPNMSALVEGDGGRGAYFPRSSSVIPAETNPNHTAMVTGARPGRSGIAANAFALYAPLLNEDTCEAAGPFDFSMAPTTTSGESPTCPQAETIFESVKRQARRRHPVTSVIMGKPKLGRIFDVTYRGRRAADYIWAPCDSTPEDDSYCESVPTNPVTGYAADDSIVMDQVIENAETGVMVRGKTRRPRFTFVNLPQVDSAGHAFGRGPIYDAAIALADTEIGRLVDTLKERGEWERSVVMVVSDHSMDTTPQKISVTQAIEGAGVPSEAFTVVQNGSIDFIYLANRRAPRAKRDALLARMREAALGAGGVTEALYRRPNTKDGKRRHTVRRVHRKWSSGARTGDLVVTSDPGYAFSEPDLSGNPLVGNHGAPQTADNFMAVLGGRPTIRTRVVDSGRGSAIANNDVAATVMGLFGLRPPRNSTGRPIRAAFAPGTLRFGR